MYVKSRWENVFQKFFFVLFYCTLKRCCDKLFPNITKNNGQPGQSRKFGDNKLDDLLEVN